MRTLSALDFVRASRSVAVELLAGRGHYDRVIGAIREAKHSVWVATANVKELRVEDHRARPGKRRSSSGAGTFRSILHIFDELAGRGVELRLLHATAPSGPFAQEFERLPQLKGAALVAGRLQMRQCPRVHLKLVVVDGAVAYLGSANFTGAGLGVKGEGRRNFELGVVTTDDLALDELQQVYDEIWSGRGCRGCRLRSVCPSPLDGMAFDGGGTQVEKNSASLRKMASLRRDVKGKVGPKSKVPT